MPDSVSLQPHNGAYKVTPTTSKCTVINQVVPDISVWTLRQTQKSIKIRSFIYYSINFMQDFYSPKSELSLLSKKSLEPTLWTMMSQE